MNYQSVPGFYERYIWVHDMKTENPGDILRDNMQKSVSLSLLGLTTRYEPKAIPTVPEGY